jgi:hypothetical protein
VPPTGSEPVDQPSASLPSGETPTTTTTEPPLQPLSPDVPESFAMSTGGPPVDLPVTIRNSGPTPLPPPTLVLSLPDGVQVVGPGNNLRGRTLVGLDGVARQRIGCPPGKGTVTCAAEGELPAGGSVTFVFRLLAGPKAAGGAISGTVTSGALLTVPVQFPLVITPK